MFGVIGPAIRARSRQPADPDRVARAQPSRARASAGQSHGAVLARQSAKAWRRWFLSHFCCTASPAANREENQATRLTPESQGMAGQGTLASKSGHGEPNLRGAKSFPRRQDVDGPKKAGRAIPQTPDEVRRMWLALNGSLPNSLKKTQLEPSQSEAQPPSRWQDAPTDQHPPNRGNTRHIFRPELSLELAHLIEQRDMQACTNQGDNAKSETHSADPSSEKSFKLAKARRGSIHVKDPTPFSSAWALGVDFR